MQIRSAMIGGFYYKISETMQPIIIDHHECYGAIDFLDAAIRIKSDLTEQRKRVSLIHELIHGVAYERRIDFEKMSEEEITENLARGLFDLIQGNPEIVEYLATRPDGSMPLMLTSPASKVRYEDMMIKKNGGVEEVTPPF